MSELKDDLAALRIPREREPVRRGRRWLGWFVLVLVVGAVGFAGLRWATRERPIDVEVSTVAVRDAGRQATVLNASGYVTARRRATVSSKITGTVVEVNVEEGMAVRAGQTLARLDDSTFRAALALAEAQLRSAQEAARELEVRLDEAWRTLGRREELFASGAIPMADVDQARAEVDSLRARISMTQVQVDVAERQVEVQRADLDNTIIRAPFSGIAISKDAQPGETVSPMSAGGGFTRTGISTIVDMDSLEIEVDVNENYINRVYADQPVRAILDAYQDFEIPARVITTVPAADRQTATMLVRIGFDELDPRILPDMGVQVTFLREPDVDAPVLHAVPLVSTAAVRTADGESYAFVVSGDRAERRVVVTGGADGDRLEIVEGLRLGERVIVSSPDGLADGTLVRTDGG